jgi:hypothetical protein
MGAAKPIRSRSIRPGAIEATELSGLVESPLTRQLTALTAQLNRLDPTKLQPPELAAMYELIEQLQPAFRAGNETSDLDFDAKEYST